jgi:hypothetical protein
MARKPSQATAINTKDFIGKKAFSTILQVPNTPYSFISFRFSSQKDLKVGGVGMKVEQLGSVPKRLLQSCYRSNNSNQFAHILALKKSQFFRSMVSCE